MHYSNIKIKERVQVVLKNKGGFKLTENSVFVLYTRILCIFGDVSVNLFLFFLAKYKELKGD